MFPARDQWWSLRLGRPIYDEAARLRYVEHARAFVEREATRLRVDPPQVLHAIRCGLLPEHVEALSASTFLADLVGRGTVPTDREVLRSLRRARQWWAQDRIAAE